MKRLLVALSFVIGVAAMPSMALGAPAQPGYHAHHPVHRHVVHRRPPPPPRRVHHVVHHYH
jgi:hypothetical protein